VNALALEGLGVKIRFSASGFEADLIALTLPEVGRETIDTTHLGTESAKAKKPGETRDLGTVQAVFDYDPAAVSLVGRPPEQVVVTYPDDLGREFDPIVLWAFATEQGGERLFPDGRMVTSITLRISVPEVADQPPIIPSLVDPLLWGGFYDFSGDSADSIVVGNPPISAQLLDGLGPIPLSVLSGNVLQFGPYSGRGSSSGVTPGDFISFGALFSGATRAGGFVRLAELGVAKAVYVGVNPYNNTGNIVAGGSNQGFSTLVTSGVRASVALAAVLNTSTREMRVYADGTYVGSKTVLASDKPTSATVGVVYDSAGGGVSASGPYTADNVWLYNGRIPDDAIAAVAAGSIPDVDGNLF
jgi:hypothetical protein